jgi:hypothetical protein
VALIVCVTVCGPPDGTRGSRFKGGASHDPFAR